MRSHEPKPRSSDPAGSAARTAPAPAASSLAARNDGALGGRALARLPEFPAAAHAALAVGERGDRHEQEADRVADQVLRAPEAPIRPAELPRLYAAPASSSSAHQPQSQAAPAVTPALSARLHSASARGAPLPAAVRSFMEPRLGVDFSGVRVHTGSAAASLSRALNAHAFTRRQDIYFAAGQFDPESARGKRLLAHELAHVVQQASSGTANLVQRDERRYYEPGEDDVVEAVIEAASQPSSIAGFDVDGAFAILNGQSLPALLRILPKVYDRGYLHGLLGYLAPGTKASDSVIIAIRVVQCQKEPATVAVEDIREADAMLVRLYPSGVPAELASADACLGKERRERERQRREAERLRLRERIGAERKKAGARQGPKTLRHGLMDWWLVPLRTYGRDDYRGQESARIQITFKPGAAHENKTITFLQTVQTTATESSNTGDAKPSVPLLDIGTKNPEDPFYGAAYDMSQKQIWVGEGAPEGYENAPTGAGSAQASLFDEPSVPPGTMKQFEAVVVVPATAEVLGALKWGVRWKSGEAEVLGAEPKDCTDSASASFDKAVERFYAAPTIINRSERVAERGETHYDAILEGFEPDKAVLTVEHKKQLDPIVAELERLTQWSVWAGGFADQSDKDPDGASKQRAFAVLRYLSERGVAKTRMNAAAFGTTWARYAPSAKESRNRRAQVMLKPP